MRRGFCGDSRCFYEIERRDQQQERKCVSQERCMPIEQAEDATQLQGEDSQNVGSCNLSGEPAPPSRPTKAQADERCSGNHGAGLTEADEGARGDNGPDALEPEGYDARDTVEKQRTEKNIAMPEPIG